MTLMRNLNEAEVSILLLLKKYFWNNTEFSVEQFIPARKQLNDARELTFKHSKHTNLVGT